MLQKLQTMKSRTSELRVLCEEFRLHLEDESSGLRYHESDSGMQPGQEAEAKNFGEKTLPLPQEMFPKNPGYDESCKCLLQTVFAKFPPA